mmetsp:Transcript_7466/g.10837  ORF Transcript_7466/g.10837 Transcript_7466/m.10837 type:complete len:84 (+) Transcript_7466:134-385(+)
MTSGFGVKGGLGRCYPFFAEYKECLKGETSREAMTCVPQVEDYFECLHHKKENAMVKAVNDQMKLNAQMEKEGNGGGGHSHTT